MADDDATIRKLLGDRNAALRAGDAGAALAPLAEHVVVYNIQPPLSFTGAAARDEAGLRAWLDTWDGPVEVEFADPTVMIDGDLAVAHGLSRMRATKCDEAPMELWYRTTVILARRGRDWRIVHEHESLPMRMDGSGLAAVDLTPEDSL